MLMGNRRYFIRSTQLAAGDALTFLPFLQRLLLVPCREYNGEVRQRCSVQSMQPVDFATESRWLLQQIQSMSVA